MVLSHAHQRPAATFFEALLLYDYNSGRKASLPQYIVEMFNEQYKQQEASKGYCKDSKDELEEKVRDLERRTWAAEGAVEDLGSLSPVQRLDGEAKENRVGSMRAPIKRFSFMDTESKPIKRFPFMDTESKPKSSLQERMNRAAPYRKPVPTKEEDVWADDVI